MAQFELVVPYCISLYSRPKLAVRQVPMCLGVVANTLAFERTPMTRFSSDAEATTGPPNPDGLPFFGNGLEFARDPIDAIED
jgi:hypothetical protein